MSSLLMGFCLLERRKFLIGAIFVVKTLKILIMFFKIFHLFEEFGIELSILVPILSYKKVISSIG